MNQHLKLVKFAALLAFSVFMLAALAVVAAAPTARHGSAVVDGVANEWIITPTNATNPDWFSASCAPAGTSCTTPSGDIFLRFACSSTNVANSTLYILGMARPGSTYAVGDSANNWIALTTGNNKIIRDGTPFTTNTSPPMWRDLTNGRGFEAALTFAPGTYSLNFHMFVNGTTSGSDFETVNLTCDPSAVTLSSMSAQSLGDGIDWSMLGLVVGLGVLTLGAAGFAVARRR